MFSYLFQIIECRIQISLEEEADMVSKWDNLSNELETIIIENPGFFQHEAFLNKLNRSISNVSENKVRKKQSAVNAFVNFDGISFEQNIKKNEVDKVRCEKSHDSKSVQCNINQSSTEVPSSNLNENKQLIGDTKEPSNKKLNSRNSSRDSKKRAKFINDLSSKPSSDVNKNEIKAAVVVKGYGKKSSSLDKVNSKVPNKLRYNNSDDTFKNEILKVLEWLPRFKGDKNFLKDLPKKFEKLIELVILDQTNNLNNNNIGQKTSKNKKHKQAIIDHLQNQGLISVQKATEVLKSKIKFFKNKKKTETAAPTVTPIDSDQNFSDKIKLELKTPHIPINIKSSTASIVEDRRKNIQIFKDTAFKRTDEIGDEPKIVETNVPFDKVEPRKFVKTEKNETLLGDLHNKNLILVDQSDKNKKEVDRNLFKDYQKAKKENESLKVKLISIVWLHQYFKLFLIIIKMFNF